METTGAFSGVTCRDCGNHYEPADVDCRCPECHGLLETVYDVDTIESADVLINGTAGSLWDYDRLLPFQESTAVSLSAGGTPLIDCPALAADLGVSGVSIKDEARNPTGSIKDREISVAVTAAREQGVEAVALPATGPAGRSAAAYAGRADMDAHVFIPSRAPFSVKAMVNVHGGDMTVVEGRYPEAVTAYSTEDRNTWYSLAPFETPFRVDGAKTVMYELVATLDELPDAIVLPTGHGTMLVGMVRGARELLEIGILDTMPEFYAAQPAGCAPIVEAYQAGADEIEPVETPDTICGALEIPDPTGGGVVLESLRATGGDAVEVSDHDTLAAATDIAETEGIEADVSCGVAIAGLARLRERGQLPAEAHVGLVNPGLGALDADVLRSHLMGKGI